MIRLFNERQWLVDAMSMSYYHGSKFNYLLKCIHRGWRSKCVVFPNGYFWSIYWQSEVWEWIRHNAKGRYIIRNTYCGHWDLVEFEKSSDVIEFLMKFNDKDGVEHY